MSGSPKYGDSFGRGCEKLIHTIVIQQIPKAPKLIQNFCKVNKALSLASNEALKLIQNLVNRRQMIRKQNDSLMDIDGRTLVYNIQ